ncbi:metallophosphoesterase [Faecalibacter sp. LW9]|uniref:metallophosphoesterase n=1 Tax=Faecalibacter sp. LW9 TaxID=3103144 RepID=UPI002AFF3CF3|nr:metallophosphoesterase [Faecalibacter sp. LW9]
MFQESLIGLLIIMFLVEIYLFFAFKSFITNKYILFGCVLSTVFVMVFMAYNFFFFDRNVGQTPLFMWSVGLFMLIAFPRVIFLLFFLTDDLIRLMGWIVNKLRNTPIEEGTYLPARRKFIYMTAASLATLLFAGFVHGMTLGKYNYKVIRERLRFKRLPQAFNGLKILHITDIHSGSIDNKEKIEKAIELINQQEFDLLLFTGDIVNNFHWEMDQWIPVFRKLKKAPLGNYAVLGNHDYGEYTDWKTEADKLDNLNRIKAIFPQIGFELLLNENRIIERNGQKIALVGVENWGARFKKAGDLTLASEGLDSSIFKILMSHDPSHWNLEVKDHSLHYDLTLSGHTHGMQLGIEVPSIGLKWSPSQYIYPQWAGFYQQEDKWINVNRGFGYHFYPGRVGIWLEITVIELTQS